jgi:hypothetical protein
MRHLILLALVSSGCTFIAGLGDRRFEDLPDAGDVDGGDDSFDAGMMDAGCDFMRCPDGTCADIDNDPSHCGGCGNACTPPENSAAVCNGGTCGFECLPGFMQVVGECVTRTIPRPIAPLSTSTVTSRRPTFRWELGASIDGARLELCADRNCASVIETLDVTGTSAQPTSELPPGVVFWRLYGRSGTEVGAEHSPPWEIFVGQRSAPIDTSWGTVLDINGDGFADVAVGDPAADSSTGRVEIYLGSPTGLAESPAVTLVGPDGAGGYFGPLALSLGDINGDGLPELAVQAREADSGAGRVHVYLGATDRIDTEPAFSLDDAGGHFGSDMSSVGDFNGDGYCDYVIGGPGVALAFLYLGSPTARPSSTSRIYHDDGTTSLFGIAISGGDINGDGLGDFAVGSSHALSYAGRVHVFLGRTSVPMLIAASTFRERPADAFTRFGSALAIAGDLNGDGFSELAVGAVGDGRPSETGSVHVYSGSSAGVALDPSTSLSHGTQAFNHLGVSAASAHDLNGDGFDDLMIGSVPRASSLGQVLVYLGSSSGITAEPSAEITSPEPVGWAFGGLLLGIGDVSADGFDDVLVGGGQGVHVFSGRSSGVTSLASRSF